ncbi:MAG: methyltransferase domain-containing protein [Candidatus Solibacter usitatus]|nr:methyltransferase domain-containing protein [Candidatus Solibacter usitatus]
MDGMPGTMAEMDLAAQALPFEPARLFRANSLHDDSQTAQCGGKRIGIFVVAYNAVTTLLPVLKRITPNVWKNVEEVVVFDDASQDATFELAVGVKSLRDLPKLKVLRHAQNLGYGGNQKAGYRYMMERGFDIVVLLHGDGQYAPEILSHLYAPIVKGEAEAVFGSRMMRAYGGPLKGGMPLYKYAGNRILTALENRVLGLELTEFHSGYRAYSLEALKRITLDNMTNDFHFDTEIIIKLKHQGMRIREVPIPTYYGGEICYVNGMKYAWNVVRALRNYRWTVEGVKAYPEFAEYWGHYALKDAPYSSHDLALRAVPAGAVVLDIGCGQGFLAERMAERGCEVTGVDSLPEPDRRQAMAEYHRCDLRRGLDETQGKLREGHFDRVLLLDVLEHLPEAEELLQQAGRYLKPDGRLLVSIPNVANITTRLQLLSGRWEYSDRGILDRTHLRFYTRRSGRGLLEQNGCEILAEQMTVMPAAQVLGFRPESRMTRWISVVLWAWTRLLPGLLGYQMLFQARRKPVQE